MKNPFVKCPGPRCYLEVKVNKKWLKLGEQGLREGAAPHLFCCAGSADQHASVVMAKLTLETALGMVSPDNLNAIKKIRIIEVDQEPAILDEPVEDTSQAQGILEQIKLKT